MANAPLEPFSIKKDEIGATLVCQCGWWVLVDVGTINLAQIVKAARAHWRHAHWGGVGS